MENILSTPAATNLSLEHLNPEQYRAVTLPHQHALILAGAGSGKTRVLTTRIAWLLHHQKVSPGGIMAVTFTNKAAREMLTRLSTLLPINVRGMWIGTFHGLCHRFLRVHHQLVNLPQSFQILDIQDQLAAIKRLLKANGIEDSRFTPKEVLWFINRAKEEGKRSNHLEPTDPNTRRKIEVYQLYENQCQREGVVDFAELMLRSYEILRDNEVLRSHYQQRFMHILVDEFQDTNRLQYAWLKMFVGQDNAVFAVGDDDQSIYAFRGARVGNMGDFVAELQVKQQIKLEENYRSTTHILDSANTLISHNQRRLGKNLRTQIGQGEPVRIFEAHSDYEEANWMVEEIRGLQSQGYESRHIALLYRSNAQSRVVESALFNAGIPYRVYGGLRFFERAEIKHALAYLRLLENPKDDSSFLRVVNFPTRGIGHRSLEQLQDLAKQNQSALIDAIDSLTGKAKVNLQTFASLLGSMRYQTQDLSLRDTVELVLQKSGLIEYYRQEREGQDRLENLDELLNAAESFVIVEGFEGHGTTTVNNYTDPQTGETLSPLAAFLSHASLESGDNQAQEGQQGVQLMTVHAAKGLEFNCVFISGLEEGLFPHENALSDTDGLEEERRLMYVAITRARQRLYLSYSQTRMLHGNTRYYVKSRFFEELPDHTLKWLTAKPQNTVRSVIPHTPPTFSNNGPDRVGPTLEKKTTLYRVGQKVFHAKFGEGNITALQGNNKDTRVQIRFNRHGSKWLLLSVAKLTRL
jgi:DNA helicase-2/ATP-dependent DNA helicase PcrA